MNRFDRETTRISTAEGTSIQGNEVEAIKVAESYLGKKYTSFQQVQADKYHFSADQWRAIVDAVNKNSGTTKLRYVYDESQKVGISTKTIVDRSKNKVENKPLDEKELEVLNQARQVLQKYDKHRSLLEYLEQRVGLVLGAVGLQQFYRGGHIVLDDQGQVYDYLVKNYKELMKPRYTAKSQTSHYTASGGYDTFIEESKPQMGIDFPSPITAHVLFGMVPAKLDKSDDGGNTFIQTEMYGFQTNYNHYVGHGQGFATSAAGYGNSGMVGYSPHSEKEKREIREEDNL